jgi:hypothetical protein
MVVAGVIGLVTGVDVSRVELPSPPSTPWSVADCGDQRSQILVVARKNASFANLNSLNEGGMFDNMTV